MGRPVYPHELGDADFSWLVNSFRENNPDFTIVESSCLPVVLIKDGIPKANLHSDEMPVLPADLTDPDALDVDPAEEIK